MVKVEVPTILRPYVDGVRLVSVSAVTVEGAIEAVDVDFPGFARRVLADGVAHRFINLYVNDEDVRFLNGLATAVAPGDVLTILPAVAGG